MKIRKKLIAMTVLLLIMADVFPVFTARAEDTPQETREIGEEEPCGSPEEEEAEGTGESSCGQPEDGTLPEEEEMEGAGESSCRQPEDDTLPEEEEIEGTGEGVSGMPEESVLQEKLSVLSDGSLPQEPETAAEGADVPDMHEELAFSADIANTSQGWIVKGVFTEFPADIIHIQPLYALDDGIYRECGIEWDRQMIEAFCVAEKKSMTCLYGLHEPLKGYLEEKTDRFYLKLRLTSEEGCIYETQAAVIERKVQQPSQGEIRAEAMFGPDVRMLGGVRPNRYVYGAYHLTVPVGASAEDIAALLPDTLPVEVQFFRKTGDKEENVATGIVDIPVAWKNVPVPQLTAGESVTVPDAAEKIIVPEGTTVRTPAGIFELDEPLGLDGQGKTDEVRLVLNIISKGASLTGALSEDSPGLEIAFHRKPTGAAAIRAYIFEQGDQKWSELSGLTLLEEINGQPLTPQSGHALILRADQEPYRSYLAATEAGEVPEPFYIGVKVEGGVYDGQQLVLAWPDTYDVPLELPKVGGQGGNENNAGASDKGDSTAEGQRPGLSQEPDRIPDVPEDSVPSAREGSHEGKEDVQEMAVPEQEAGLEMPVALEILEMPVALEIQEKPEHDAYVPAAHAQQSDPERSGPGVRAGRSAPPVVTASDEKIDIREQIAVSDVLDISDAEEKSRDDLVPVSVIAVIGACILVVCKLMMPFMSDLRDVLRKILEQK